MKYVFVSDIHGNVERLEECVEAYEREQADKLVILGDTAGGYYDGDNYLLAEILNGMKDKVEVIRGNCDTSDFEDCLDFEIFDDDTLYVNNKFITIMHGHRNNCYNLPPNCGDIFIQGHTHVPMLIKQGGRILANPGSVARSRGSDLRCYILIDEEYIYLKALNGSLIKQELL